jgi:hypothetical protein
MHKGIFTFVKRKATLVDGEWQVGDITEVVEKKNNIQYGVFRSMMDNGTLPYNVRATISTVPMKGMANVITSPIVTDNWIVGTEVTPPLWTPGDINASPITNGFWTIQTRFTPPAQTRYVWAAAVRSSAFNSQAWSNNVACASLDVACEQGTDEVLDVFYRVFIDLQPAINGDIDAPLTMVQAFAEDAMNLGRTGAVTYDAAVDYYPQYLAIDGQRHDAPGRFSNASVWTNRSDGTPVTTRNFSYSSFVNMLFGHQFSTSIPGASLSDWHGMPIKSFSVMSNRDWGVHVTAQPVSKGVLSSVQNTYARGVDDGSYRLPALDVDALASSLTDVIVTDDGSWASTVNEPFVHQYRIEITQGGLVGTAEYRIRRRRCTGWAYGSYQPHPIAIPNMKTRLHQTHLDDTVTSVRHGQVERFVFEYLWPEFLTVGPEGITVVHVNGDWENIDADSAIPLSVSDILQVAPERDNVSFDLTGNLYVACGNTGLWKVTRSSGGPVSAVNQITPIGITNPNSCRAVVVNRANGDVWAIFHDTTDATCYLAKSTDMGSTWTLYDETTNPQFLLPDYTSGTPGPSNIIGIQISPYNGNNEMFICAPDVVSTEAFLSNYTSNQGFWWSESGSSPTSDAVRYNDATRGSGWVKVKIVASKSVTPLHDGSWVMSGDYASGNRNYGPSTARAFFGGATPSATFDTTATSTGRNMYGAAGNLIYHDDLSNQDYLIGPRDGFHFGTPYRFSITAANVDFVARLPAEFNTSNGLLLYTAASPSVTTSTLTSTNYPVGYAECAKFFYNFLEHIGKGIFVGNRSWFDADDVYPNAYNYITFYGDGLVTTEHQIPWFESWGWNGSSWEMGQVGNRVTHSTDELILDGLTLRFDDHGGVDPLITGEYYDVYVYDGVLLDSATAITQRVYNFMTATSPGTDFTPGTVPASDVGSVVSEPLYLAFTGVATAHTGLSDPQVWGEPGKIIGGSNGGNTVYTEHRLSGDFEVRFKLVQFGDYLDANYWPRIGLTNWSAIEGAPTNLSTTDPGHRLHIRYVRTGMNNVTNDLEYTVQIRTGTFAGTLVNTLNVTDGSEDDVFAFRRTSGTVELLINGVSVHNFGTINDDLCFTNYTLQQTSGTTGLESNADANGGWTLYDGEVDYDINRRYVEIGNGIDTGASDINLMRMAVERLDGLELVVNLDGIPATLLADSVTAPGPGEVNVLPYSGRLWFNAADAGKAITGNWRILKKLNLE